MNVNRLIWLDFMKGMAIILVVLGHVYQYCLNDTGNLFLWIYSFHMPFFFMLSGILVSRSENKKAFDILSRKAKALLVPFLFSGLLFVALYNRLHVFIVSEFHAGYWFLLSLFTCWVFYLVARYILIKIKAEKYPVLCAMILLLPFVLFKLPFFVHDEKIFSCLSLGFTSAFYRFFILGYIIGKYERVKNIMFNPITSSILILSFISITVISLKYGLVGGESQMCPQQSYRLLYACHCSLFLRT